VDYHLDRAFKLHTQIEYKNLYNWAITEISEDGKAIDGDKIPWIWSLYFSANECILGESIEIIPDFSLSDDKSTPKTSEVQFIRVKLRPNNVPGDENSWRNTQFSMFGTSRVIKDFTLDIRELDDQNQQEVCQAWGIVSYTRDINFRKEKTDDVLGFELFVKSETLSRYIDLIKAGAVSDIILRVGRVPGFYSDWSPDISTSSVKVLTSYNDHAFQNPEGLELQPPRLGIVGETSLNFTKRLVFKKPDAEMVEEVHAAVVAAAPIAPGTSPIMMVPDLEIKARLKSLRTVGWWIVVFLAIIAVKASWR
jgi:hypothetical protein